jgi:hypothetical protein
MNLHIIAERSHEGGSITDVTFPNELGYRPSKLQRDKAGAANEP